jgi:hypothetical protein
MRGFGIDRTTTTALVALLATLLVVTACSSDDTDEGSDDSTPPTTSDEAVVDAFSDAAAAEGGPLLVDLIQQRRQDEGLEPYEVPDELAATLQPFVDQWVGGQLTEDEAREQAGRAAVDAGFAIDDVVAIRAAGDGHEGGDLDAEQLGRVGAAPGFDTLAVVGADSDAAGAVYLRVAAGPELTDEHLAEHARRAEQDFVAARERLDLPVPDEVTEGPLYDVALELACSDALDEFPYDIATTNRDEFWLSALRSPGPWVGGEVIISETDEYRTSGVQQDGEEIEQYAIATCDTPDPLGALVSGVALGYPVPDDAAVAAWSEQAEQETATRDTDAREAAGLEPLTRDPALDAAAEDYGTTVAAIYAEGAGDPPSPPSVPGQTLELWYDWQAPLRLVSMGTPEADAKVLSDQAQTVGYAAVSMGGSIAIVRVTGLTPSP